MTPRRRKKWPRDPFDFDAPKFTDFCRTPFRKVKELLEEALKLPKSASNPYPAVSNCTGDEFTVTQLDQRFSEDFEDWFERAHSSHEPSSPLSPPRPLITPPRAERISGSGNSGKRKFENSHPNGFSPLRTPTLRRGRRSSIDDSDLNASFSAEKSLSFNSNLIGRLKSRPQRIPLRSSSIKGGSSFRGDSLAVEESPLRSSYTKHVDSIRCSAKKTALRSSLMFDKSVFDDDDEEDRLGFSTGRISSLPSLEGWIENSNSSIPSPPKCHLPVEEDTSNLPKQFNGPRKLGLTSRAARIQIPTKEDDNDEGVPLVPAGGLVSSSRHVSPTIKRLRTDTKFCPIPSTSSSLNPARNPTSKKSAININDLKKKLAEHNKRLKPGRR